jgi:fatty-acyl-CoA synthase
MFHAGGLNIQTTPALHLGATVTIAQRFDPGATLALLASRRHSLFIAVPAMIQALINHEDWAKTDLSGLRMFTTGSSTIPLPLLKAWLDRDIPVTQVYGLTETGPVSTVTPVEDAERKVGSCGKPAPYCEARVVDGDGLDVAAELRGEIVLRGPGITTGYWNNPAATAEAFGDGGWFRTGDIGHWDSEGYLYVDDRAKDVVISGGENVYPAELEDVLARCPEIAEAAVVGRADNKWGEVPVAMVVLREPAGLEKQAILDLFEGKLARFKHPKDVLFVDTLPRNSMGKVLKFELREQIAGGSR